MFFLTKLWQTPVANRNFKKLHSGSSQSKCVNVLTSWRKFCNITVFTFCSSLSSSQHKLWSGFSAVSFESDRVVDITVIDLYWERQRQWPCQLKPHWRSWLHHCCGSLLNRKPNHLVYSHLSVLQAAHKSLLHTWLDLFERVIEITSMSLANAKGISVLVVLQRSYNTESSVSWSSMEVLLTLVYTSDYFQGQNCNCRHFWELRFGFSFVCFFQSSWATKL